MAGDLIVIGTGNTSFFDTGLTEADSITFNDALIINPGQTHTFRATAGGILFQLPGTLNGTLPNSPLNPANQENVILDATGNIQIVGAIGNNAQIHNLTILRGANITFNDTISISGDLIIERGAQITFERDVRIGGNLIIGDAADLSRIGSVTFTPGARLDVQGDIEIYSQGAVNFRNDVGQIFEPDNVTVVSGDLINFEGRFDADQVQLTAGSNHDIYFNQQVRVRDMHARAGNLIRVDSTISVGTGNLTLTTNRIELLGGAGSIRNQTGTSGVSTLTIEPFTASRNMAVGAPVFFFGEEGERLNITYREIAAINTGFFEVIFGDVVNGTGDVFVSDLGSTPNNFFTSPPAIQNPTTIVGGRVQVGYVNDPTFFDPEISDVFEFIQPTAITVSNAAEYLRFKALVTDVRIDAPINTFIQRNGWIRMEAERDIIINRPVQALRRISLTSGYSGAIAGSVIVNSTGENTGHLFTTQSTTTNHVIEISAGRSGGAMGGNIVFTDVEFTDAGGDITVWARNAGSRILMQAPGGSITQNDGLLRAEILSLTSHGDISLDLTDVVRIGAGTIDGATLWKDGFVKDSGDNVFIDGIIITGPGSLTMLETDALIIDNILTASGAITITNLVDSEGDFLLGTLNATSGPITLTADGAIRDNLAGQNIVNLTTTGLVTLEAKTGIGGPGIEDIDTDIGSLQAKTTVSGGIHIDERNGLVIAGPVTTSANGPVLISLQTGDLTVNDVITPNGSGNLLLEVLQGAANINAAVTTTTGNIYIDANLRITLGEDAVIRTATPGTIGLISQNRGIVMDAAATVTANNSAINLTSLGLTDGDIILGTLAAPDVVVISENFSIFRAADSGTNVFAENLQLSANNAIGTPADPLSIQVDTLAAEARGVNDAIRGLFIVQDGDVTVGLITPVDVFVVDVLNNATATMDNTAPTADLRTGNNGNLVLVAEGTITLTDGDDSGASVEANGSGNIRIESVGTDADILVEGHILSGTGNITLFAANDLTLDANVTTAAPGTVYLVAEAGTLTMDSDAVVTAANSSILTRSEADSILGLLVATNVSARSFEGSIYSAEGVALNVQATRLRLEAQNAIGTSGRPLRSSVSELSARAVSASETEKGIFIEEATALVIRDVEVTVNAFLANATTAPVTEISQADLVTLNDGDIVLVTLDGSIELTDADASGFSVSAQGSGSITLTAGGSGSDILIQSAADVLGGTGDVTLTADRDIRLNAANVDILTGGAGAISLSATTGTIFMTDGSTLVSEDGDIALFAETDIDVSLIESENGDLNLEANTGAIRDNTLAEDANLVTSGTATLKAATGIGSNATPEADLNTRVAKLSALNTTSGDIILSDEDGFTVVDDGVENQAVSGDIRMLVQAGTLGVDAPVLTASGNIALVGLNPGTAILVNDSVTANAGHLTLRADAKVEVYAPVSATGIGTIFVNAAAATGEVIMLNDGETTFGGLITENRDILVEAGQDARVSNINAGTAAVEIVVFNGAITGGGSIDVTASSLRLRAETGIGEVGDPLLTNVATVAALTQDGPIQISNLSDLIVGTVGTMSVMEVLYSSGLALRAAATPGSDVSISDIRTLGAGDIGIFSSTGSITLTDGVIADGIAVQSQGGAIVVEAATFVLQQADILTNGEGTARVQALGGRVEMEDGVKTQTGSGDIAVLATGDVFLSLVESTNGGDLTVEAGDRILDNTLLELPNLRSTGLATLQAVNGIGGLHAADINTDVGALAGLNTDSGRIVIREVNGLEIDAAGLVNTGSEGDIIVTVVLGDLTVNGEVETADGNLLLEVLQGALSINEAMDSDSGLITLTAQTDVAVSANITSSADVAVDAATGSIVFDADAVLSATGASARLSAAHNLILGQVNGQHVSLLAGNDLTRALNSATNIQSETLRIAVGGSVASSAEKLLTDVNTLTVSASGSIFLHNLSDVTVGEVAVTTDTFTVTADIVPVFDLAQSNVISTTGDVVLVNDGHLSLGLVQGGIVTLLVDENIIHLPGSGTNVIADSLRIVTPADIGTESAPVVIQVATLAARADNLYISALGDLLLGVVTDTEGADNGLTVEDEIILSATGNLSMGPVSGTTVDLSSGGDIINVTGTLLNILAKDLTLTAQGHIGSLAAPIQIDTDVVRGSSATGSIHLDARGDLLIDSLVAAEDIFINVEDALGSAPGAVTNLTAIRARLTAGSDIGPLTGDISILAARSDSGAFELTNAGTLTLGTIEGLHGVTAETGVILTTLAGRILDGGDLNDDVISGGPVVLNGFAGLGLASNGLEVTAPQLTLTLAAAGSAFINVTGDTELLQAAFAQTGNLSLNVTGSLRQSGAITLPGGSAFLNIGGTLTVDAAAEVAREIRLTAAALVFTAAGNWQTDQDQIQLQIAGDVLMAAGSRIEAVRRNLRIQSGGTVTAARLTAGRILDIRAAGDLTAVSTTRTTHELQALSTRLDVGGTILPILTRTQRLDVRAGGVEEIYEFDDLTTGYFGLQLVEPAPGDSFTLRMNSATLDAIRPTVRLDGDVVLVLLSGGTVNLAAPMETPEGDLLLEVNRLTFTHNGPVLLAPLGDVRVEATQGAGTPQLLVGVDAATFSALAQSGSLGFDFVTPVRVQPQDVRLVSGSGSLYLNVQDGDLTVDAGAQIQHTGTGELQIRTQTGRLVSNNLSASQPPLVAGGELRLVLASGVQVNGATHLRANAARFSADITTGNLRIFFGQALQIASRGVELRAGGSGNINLHILSGDLTFAANADIQHRGSGNLSLTVTTGALLMNNGNVIRVTTGELRLTSSGLLRIGLLLSLGTLTRLQSQSNTILAAPGSTVNLQMSSDTAHLPDLVVPAGQLVQLTLDARNAFLNGKFLFRGTNPFLVINEVAE